MRRGDRAGARAMLGELPTSIDTGDTPWLLLAQIEQALGDDAAADAALLRHLERSPRELLGLLMLGAIRARRGDERGATTWYRTALAVASRPGAAPPPSYTPLLRDAQAFMAGATERFASHLEAAVRDAQLDRGAAGARIRASLDLLMGRSELFLQQPSMFYFPGLAQRAFFEREEFDWLPAIEAAVPAMRAELDALIAADEGFAPYVQRTAATPAPANPLLDDDRWSAQYLWRNGVPSEPAASRCPATMAALAAAPIPVIAARSPIALFSVLKPGAHIRPHHGLLNTRLICHVPLIAPAGCGLRVGAETRTWEAGKALIFDDSIEHEAWNRGSSTRVVLLFEVWRPDIAAQERTALTRIFEAIDDYQGVAEDAG